jgi:hypothetical protein
VELGREVGDAEGANEADGTGKLGVGSSIPGPGLAVGLGDGVAGGRTTTLIRAIRETDAGGSPLSKQENVTLYTCPT